MNMLRRCCNMFCLLLLVASSCLEPYQPPIIKENPEFLVVDGFVDRQNGSTRVVLFRTVTLASGEVPSPELRARVTVEDESGQVYALTEEKGSGIYSATGMNLNSEKKYQLRIKTIQNTEYLSEFVTLKNTPPIEDIFWNVTEEGVTIYLNTSDPTGNSKYYKWSFSETWEYFSRYNMGFKLVRGNTVYFTPEEFVYQCWKTVPPTNVLVATTNRLQQDVVSNFKLNFIPKGSLKLSKKYSMFVQQQTLSEDGYNYWLNVQKTTENLGGLFDPLPSQVIGNIHCVTNPNEPVIGYFDGASISEERIFIGASDLPPNYSLYRYQNCELDTVLFADPGNPIESSNLVLGFVTQTMGTATIGYLTSSLGCIDCRVFGGGVTKRPDFWK